MGLSARSRTSGRCAVLVKSMAGFAVSAALIGTGISSLKSIYSAKVQFNVGSQLKLFSADFKISENYDETINAPKIELVSVSAKRVRYIARHQEFVISGIAKNINEAPKEDLSENAERQALAIITQQFKLAGQPDQVVSHDLAENLPVAEKQNLPEQPQITFAPTDEYVHEASHVDNAALLAVIKEAQPSLDPLNTQPQLAESALDTQQEQADEMSVASGSLLAANDGFAHSDDYSIALSALASAQAEMAAPKHDGQAALTVASVSAERLRRPSSAQAAEMDTQSSETQQNPIDVKAMTAPSSGIVVGLPQAEIAAQSNDNEKQGDTGPADLMGLAKLATQNSSDSEASLTTQSTQVLEQAAVQQTAPYYGGRITAAFSNGNKPIEGATVQIIGAPWKVKTDSNGQFVFENASVDGVLPVMITKDGYLKRRLDLKANRQSDAELIDYNSVMISAKASQDNYIDGTGYVFGQLVSPATNDSAQAMRVEVQGPTTVFPVYLDEKGVPNQHLAMTSVRGQFMLLNLRPGTYFITITDPFGTERAPHVIHVGQDEGIVRKFSLGERRVITGSVSNATVNRGIVEDAKIQLLGNSKSAQTKADGTFALGPVYVDCAELNYLQIEKPGYYRNRIDYGCSKEQVMQNYFIFPASYVDGLSADSQVKLAPNTGVVVGHASFSTSVKLQLWGPEEIEPQTESARGKDFYFDKDGILNSARNRTSANGIFAILDAPEGLSYVQAFNKENQTLSYWPIFISPSTVNVYSQ